MSKYEERAFPVGKVKSDLAILKSQLARMKEDLGRFIARKPDGVVIPPLRERIRELEAEIADADQRAKDAQASRAMAADAPEKTTSSMRSTTGLFPPRRR
jgi:hypothetical protein